MAVELVEVTAVSARLQQFGFTERNCRVEEFTVHHQADIFAGNECLLLFDNIVNPVGLVTALAEVLHEPSPAPARTVGRAMSRS
jgi:hypothetical protein